MSPTEMLPVSLWQARAQFVKRLLSLFEAHGPIEPGEAQEGKPEILQKGISNLVHETAALGEEAVLLWSGFAEKVKGERQDDPTRRAQVAAVLGDTITALVHSVRVLRSASKQGPSFASPVNLHDLLTQIRRHKREADSGWPFHEGAPDVFVLPRGQDVESQPSEPPEPVTWISPLAYLRSVWAVIWGAFRHPLSTTVIDLSTGAAVHVPPRRPKTKGREPLHAARPE